MKIVADKCVYGPIVVRLRVDGHDVIAAKDVMCGSDDPDVLALAVRENALLLTQDHDFGELIYRQQMPHTGVILLRLASVPAKKRIALVSQALIDHAAEMVGAFTVMTPGGIRIRKTI